MTALANYDERGIPTITLTFTITPADGGETETRKLSPSQFLTDTADQRDLIIIQGLRTIVKEATAKSDLAATLTSKTSALTKALLEVRRYKTELGKPGGLDSLEKRMHTAIQKIKLDDLIEKAKKAEFKEQRKKAFEHYSDALFFLKNEADESLRDQNSSAIEAAITKLKGECARP